MHTNNRIPTAPGVFSDDDIRILIRNGHVSSALDQIGPLVQPASLDLQLGRTAYRVKASFLPGPDFTVEEQLKDLALHSIDLEHGAVLEVGCTYIVRLAQYFDLPDHVSASTNPKSSTGRLDVFTRTLCDHASRFDTCPKGYSGHIYIEITPQTFPIKVRTGSRLTQIRFASKRVILNDEEHLALHAVKTITSRQKPVIDAGISISINLDHYPIVGYRAKKHTDIIDVDAIGALNPKNFWEPIQKPENGSIILDPGEFYILASSEEIFIPFDHAAEMIPFDPGIGKLTPHYAGFFDPGFGSTTNINKGSRAVLEVRSHEVPFIVRHGQIIGRLNFEKMHEVPSATYGAEIQSNYQGQGLKLSKHFQSFNHDNLIGN